MSDVNATVERENKEADGGEKQTFKMRLPRMPIELALRGITEEDVRRLKETSEKMKAVSEELTGALRESYLNTAKVAADYGLTILQITSANTSSTLEFFGDLMATKSMPEIVQLSTGQLRKNLNVAATQNAELWDLIHRTATVSAQPIGQALGRAAKI